MGYSFITEKFKKRWIRATFLMENGQLDFKTCPYEVNNTFTIGKCAYIVDGEKIHYDKSIPYLFYFHDNPNPITFTKVKHEFNGRVITSENFNDILDSKVIKEMVSAGQEEKLLLILMCVLILIGLLNLASSAGVFTPHAVNATMNMTANASNVIIH